MKTQKQIEAELHVREAGKKRLELLIQSKEKELDGVKGGELIETIGIESEINILRQTWNMNEGAIDALEFCLID